MGVVGRLDQYASMLAYEFDDYSMSENLLLYSEQFNNAAWFTQNASITANTSATTAPDGTNSADKVVELSNGMHGLSQILGTISAGSYTVSCFVKAGGRYKGIIDLNNGFGSATAFFDLNAGTITSSVGTTTITSYPNGWYRITASSIFVSDYTSLDIILIDNSGNISYTGDGTSGIYLWGAQVERGSVATDYTPTTTTAINRVLASTTNTNITGLGTYYSSGFDENVGFTTFLSANIFPPYDPVYDEFGGTLFGAGQGRYMRQNTDKSVIVYNEIDEITTIY